MTTLDFWFDPACPWTWITSRWLVEVAGAEGHDVRWHTFSLAEKNKDVEIPEQYREGMELGRRALRVLEAVRANAGEQAVGDLDTELGRRFHHGRSDPGDLAGALTGAGLDAAQAAAGDDESLDDVVRTSMREALALVGDDVGVPVLAFPPTPGFRGFSGPIMSPAPTGDDAVALFEAVRVAATTDGFAEVTRGPQPRRSIAAFARVA